MDTTFEPGPIEERWARRWEESGAFRPPRPHAPTFTILLPPPNVTGHLHIGHALDQTLQDILIRWQRLKGCDARWIVGTDHAGIATQLMVERELAREGRSRHELGREAFLARVWDWKARAGGTITHQMRRLGASCDWAHEHFTMDPAFSRAVTEAFVRLSERGLVYRAKRLVNWDPALETAISDLEVENREVKGHFWHLRYPLADGSGHLVVATTRPETMLGDTAVAVNPADERYRHLVGRAIAHPLTGRRIPVIADPWADPELGSGCVKITPAHDFNDWAVYERHPDIGWLDVLDARARIAPAPGVPAHLVGLDRFAARERIVAELASQGLLERVEERVIQVPHGDRSGVPIEPRLTDQWFLDVKGMARRAIETVRAGQTRFVPEGWTKTFFHWLENIEPWCLSRQLWWGHRIPAWYGPDGQVVVARSLADAQARAGPDVPLRQDEDVLDTWFSSALWPFATLGWPDRTPDPRHFPSSVLVTGFDIIFFWVARMMMLSLELVGEHPFAVVYVHGLVRDAQGRKMSKTRGNAVDPIAVVDRYGADALRFALAGAETQGRDVKFDERRVEACRNFGTKLWNAVRFARLQGVAAATEADPPTARHPVNRWILAETARMAHDVDLQLQQFRFDQAADRLYRFAWGTFCDWYLELAKPLLADDEAATETRAAAGWALDRLLTCLHPYMPFLTEELWHALGPRPHDLIVGRWPEATPPAEADTREIAWLIELVQAIRSARAELNVPPGARLRLHAPEADADVRSWLERHRAALGRLARIEEVLDHPAPARGAAQLVVQGRTYTLPLTGVIDLAAERARLERAAAEAERAADALAERLANPGFLARARPEAVAKARADHEARRTEAERLRAALARLA
ncbi:MAG: valine--tRNA ligase [Sphingomonadaceae bacterium]|uniref:valine--tRNA ligase n=1 Tax=Thermaurantiacus sp. TaxID=2820283 RepID=UPI00298EDCF9|nr:valine--tRNA ligase [Thermaurantiacus sp.]MCS6986610.1 valine--tRNA ligase [Sphingomonadaceae bacterium]MDW8414129.1 valine--tRNA ligase [Thermaurantiacus sp.]